MLYNSLDICGQAKMSFWGSIEEDRRGWMVLPEQPAAALLN